MLTTTTTTTTTTQPITLPLVHARGVKIELKIKRWSRDGRVKKYTNKICRDNQIHYTSLHLLLDHLVTNIIIWKKAASHRVAMKNFLLGRPVSLLLIASSHHYQYIVHWAWAERSSMRERRGLWATDFGHMISPWQQCRSIRIIIWQNGVSHTHF